MTQQFEPLPHSNRQISYAQLGAIVSMSRDFNSDSRPEKLTYLLNQFDVFNAAMSPIPGYKGTFGTGYPFYAIKGDGTVSNIEEIDRFLSETKKPIDRAVESGLGAWACVGCQRDNKLPDLKQFCKPCDVVDVKPRDIFKATPDLDFWVVLEDVDAYKLGLVQAMAARAGFFPSDSDIFSSLNDTFNALNEYPDNPSTATKLPIDLHVVSQDEFEAAMQATAEVLKNEYVPGANPEAAFVPISPVSLHVLWEKTDVPYDFTKDFLLSLTLHPDSAPSLGVAFEETKSLVKEVASIRDITEIITRHPKEQRQLDTSVLRTLLAERWSN